MDPITHTLIAVGSLFGIYYLGRFLYKREDEDGDIDDIISAILDKLEKDGFVAVEKDEDSGEKTLILISEIVAKSITDELQLTRQMAIIKETKK